jgi:serine protease Do
MGIKEKPLLATGVKRYKGFEKLSILGTAMLKKTIIAIALSVGFLLGFSSITVAQSAESSQNFNFYVSWSGKRLGIIANTSKKKVQGTEGVVVQEVIKDTAADRTGIKAGDLIVKVDGQAVKKRGELINRITQIDYGKEFSVEVLRDTKPMQFKVVLVESTDNLSYYNYYSEKAAEALNKLDNKIRKGVIGTKPSLRPQLGFYGELSNSRLRVATQDLTEQLGQYFGVENGGVLISVVQKDGPADRAGFKAGDCIVALNGIAIGDRKSFRKELKKVKSGEVQFDVVRDRQRIELRVMVEPRSN